MAILSEFHCTECAEILGYTAPGEAKRMSRRARLYCAACKDAPGTLTSRQQEFVEALAAMAAEGVRPTYSGAAERMGISTSRGQQIATAIRARGHGGDLDRVLGVDETPPPVAGDFPSPNVRVVAPNPPYAISMGGTMTTTMAPGATVTYNTNQPVDDGLAGTPGPVIRDFDVDPFAGPVSGTVNPDGTPAG